MVCDRKCVRGSVCSPWVMLNQKTSNWTALPSPWQGKNRLGEHIFCRSDGLCDCQELDSSVIHMLPSSQPHWSQVVPRPLVVVACASRVIWCSQTLCWKHRECFLGGYPGGQRTPWWGSSKTLLPFSNENENVILHMTLKPHVKRNKFSYHRWF